MGIQLHASLAPLKQLLLVLQPALPLLQLLLLLAQVSLSTLHQLQGRLNLLLPDTPLAEVRRGKVAQQVVFTHRSETMQNSRKGRPLLGVSLPACPHESSKCRRACARNGQSLLLLHHSPGHLESLDALEGNLVRQQFPEHHTEGPDVAGLRRRQALDHLGCHPGKRARQRHTGGSTGKARRTEVADLACEVRTNDNVVRLQVSVYHLDWSLLVQVVHPGGNLDAPLEDLGEAEHGVVLLSGQECIQGPQLCILGHDAEVWCLCCGAEELDDVSVT
uniref:Putative secreted protein n=1 Tax=Ixodes ricinus TaxID=34613 RepID=A0A6B0V776_IXORI